MPGNTYIPYAEFIKHKFHMHSIRLKYFICKTSMKLEVITFNIAGAECDFYVSVQLMNHTAVTYYGAPNTIWIRYTVRKGDATNPGNEHSYFVEDSYNCNILVKNYSSFVILMFFVFKFN